PARTGDRLSRAGATHAAAARKHPRARYGTAGQVERAQGRIARPDHQGTGYRPAVFLRAVAAVQMLWRGFDRGIPARARSERDPWRREFAALHAALRDLLGGSRSAGRRGSPGIAERSAPPANRNFGTRRGVIAVPGTALHVHVQDF